MKATFNTNELRAELARRGWRQRDLAERAGLSLSLIKWVCRGAQPSSRAAKCILDAVGAEAAGRITKVDPQQ